MKMPLLFHKNCTSDSIALLAGMLLTLAFAPFGIFPLGILSPALLLYTLLNATRERAFWRGFLFGLGFFATGVYWIFISIHTFGNIPAIIAFFITAGFIAILALFPAFTASLFHRFYSQKKSLRMLLGFPVIWVILEWIRSWLFSGFPWLFVGYTQMDSPLKGYAPILSVYGVSLLTIFSSALLVYLFLQFKKSHYRQMYFGLLTLALVWTVGGVLSLKTWTKPVGTPIQISLVQGNIAQELKWSYDQIQPTMEKYVAMTRAHWDSKIVIWPESSIPLPLQNASDFFEALGEEAFKHQSTLIFGVPVRARPNEYYNGVLAYGMGKGIYFKKRLVPFGEFIPMKEVFGKVLNFMNVPMSDFIPGTEDFAPITIDNIKIATFICYEITYPEQVLSYDGNINLILTVSNDAWFGKSIAQAQHLEMARMRALEMGRPVISVSNNGITAFIFANGKVQSAAPPYQDYVLTDTVQPMQGETPWEKMGMDVVLVLMMVMIVSAVVLG
jgi:apolipoprotein N-acyltransferase